MRICEKQLEGTPPVTASIGEHVLTVAEAGFSMLDVYARGGYGVTVEEVRRFANRVNELDTAGSLFPLAPVSALPRKYLRGDADPGDVHRHVLDFLKANAEMIHAPLILIDLRVCADPVPQAAIDACKAALLNAGMNLIKSLFRKSVLNVERG